VDITLTVLGADRAARADVRVVAAESGPAGPVLDHVRATVGAATDQPLTVDGRRIAEDGTVADCGLVAGAIVRVGAPTMPPDPATAELVVRTGPDAGRRLALTAGEHIIGRGRAGGLAVDDPAISRRHLQIRCATDIITLTDVGSSNGTRLDGRDLSAGVAVEIRAGAILELGDSRLAVGLPGPRPTAARSAEQMTVHPPPRLHAAAAPVTVEFPAPPAQPARVRIPVLASLAPLVAGLALAGLLRQWQFLAFTALSPVMMIAQATSDLRSSRRGARRAGREHAAAVATAQARLAHALDDERRRRLADSPDLGDLIGAARTRDRWLWSRRAGEPDGLSLRLGRADLPSEVAVAGRPLAVAVDVPVVAALPSLGTLGVCGPRDPASALVRSLIVQAAILHGPARLRIWVLAPGRAADWAWTRWLPHLAPHAEGCCALVGFDEEQVAQRVKELRARPLQSDRPDEHAFVVVDCQSDSHASPGIAELVAESRTDVSVIWLADDEHDLPERVGAIATVDSAPRPSLRYRRAGDAGSNTAVVPDLLARDLAEAVARTLAPLREGTATQRPVLPRDVWWADLNGVDLHHHDGAVRYLMRQWSRGPSTEVNIGRDAVEPVTIDVCRDGPHALLAGTTGSGKSELLLGLVGSLVARNRPDRLSLLLIDHKGGATFGRCARFPHTLGVVTDLDAEGSRRALRSLGAELRRRETTLAAASRSDFETLSSGAAAPTDRAPLARLVIIVDEFATLVDEQPDFVPGLVDIARRGRSLGVHLVLATQRPEGVVSADIRANTRLRICLGVAQESESRDVIGCADAARISSATPGRGFVRIGPGDLREFQAARISAARTPSLRVTVSHSPVESLGSPPGGSEPAGDATIGDLDALALAVTEVTDSLGIAKPTPFWLPALPDVVTLAGLDDDCSAGTVAWGLVDLPDHGQQQPLRFELARARTTLIAGSARSGRTTAVRTIAVSAATRWSPTHLHMWAVDSANGLADLARMPHCGAVVAATDRNRLERLLDFLGAEISGRRQEGRADRPALMLIVDSWDGLFAALDQRDAPGIEATLLRVMSDGPAADVHTIVTTDRGGLVGRLASMAAEKIVLRLADPSDFALSGVPARDVPRHLPAGRGIRAADQSLVQIAIADDASVARAGRWSSEPGGARNFEPPPARISLDRLGAVSHRHADWITLGLEVANLSTLRLTRPSIRGPLLVAGPPESGRTTALALLGVQLRDRRIAISCSDQSVLLALPGSIHLPHDDQDHAAELLDSLCRSGEPAPHVLIDDVDRLGEGPLWSRLEQLLRAPLGDGQLIALAGLTDALSMAFRGPVAAARRTALGLLLTPTTAHDGELFGIKFAHRPGEGDPPGRAWFARRGKAVAVQLAEPSLVAASAAPTCAQPAAEIRSSATRACSAEWT
jgi:S-DNA-T family DNA segregation ATPase FtsK/SpoIIIE